MKLLLRTRKNRRKTAPFPLEKGENRGFRFNLSIDCPTLLCDGHVSYTENCLRVYIDKQVAQSINFDEISSLRVVNGVGCINLFLQKKDGNEMLLCRSDNVNKSDIVKAVKKLNAILSDKAVKHSEDNQCPKCGRPHQKGNAVCKHCSGKRMLLKRVWGLIWPYKFFVIMSLVMFLLVSGGRLILPYLNRVAVDEHINNSNPSSVNLSSFGLVLLSMLAVELVLRGFSALRSHLLIHASNKMVVSLRKNLFEKIERLSVGKVTKREAGDLIHTVTGDSLQVESFLVNYLPSVLEQIAVFIAVGIFIFIYDIKLFLLIVLPTPFVLIAFMAFWRFMATLFHKRRSAAGRTNSILHDIFSGIRVVKAFGMEKKENERFSFSADNERHLQEQSDCIWSILLPLLRYLICFGEFVILFYVGNKILGGSMTLGEMAQFSSYASMLYTPLRAFAHIPRHVMLFMTASSKVFDVLDEDEEVIDSENPIDIELEGNITLKNVTFGYDEGVDVLKDISLDIKKGEFIGLVGSSGVGKSTLINLIMRLYDTDEGSILIDGIDIKNISQESLRSQMGVVLQETFLFSGSVYENIAYAKPSASYEEIIKVSKLSGCHDFITRLTDGYNTKVGEKGLTLSGGERQRIAIARALLHNPKILILDEATASLDTETEKQIQDALANLSKNRTTVAIAHRLSTLRNATRLVVLDKGEVAEVGTQEELFARRGIYYELVMAQREMNEMHDK